jgi:hypothetical protein
MENNKQLVLVYRGMPKVDRTDRFSIVITPQNYLLRKEHLAIKQEYQSRKIASSLFDDFIEEDKDEYSFFVYKEQEDWIFIAYKQKEIMDLLEEVGIPTSNVDEIFFAQQFVSSIKKPISLGEKNALISLNSIATVVNKNMLPDTTEYVHISNDIQPKKAVFLSKEFIFDSKNALLISIVFVIFGLLFLIEGRSAIRNHFNNTDQINEILKNKPSLSSSYTRESILTKYQKIDNIQRAKRDLIAKLSKIINNSVKIDGITIDKNRYKVLLSVTSKQQIPSVISKAKQQGLKIEKESQNQFKIEGVL